MKRAALPWLICCAVIGQAFAQTPAVSIKSPAPEIKPKKEQSAPPNLPTAGTNGPITTEIFADEAFFDSSKNIGIFTGSVKVNDPRFNVQSDKLTVYVSKG